MNEQEIQKVKQFLGDRLMHDTIYKAIQDEFLSDSIVKDVQVLAASRLSISFLKQAFKRMERYKKEEKEIKEVETKHV